MDVKLKAILNHTEDNHMLPFFWMHSGERHLIRRQVQAVYESGARALCVESRPHENFGQDEWWGDMDVVLDEAQKLGMRVWILDDKHFPTGFANGLIRDKYPERRRWHLIEDHVDMAGPQKECMLLFNPGRGGVKTLLTEEDELVGAYAYRQLPHGEKLTGEPVDLTGCVQGDFLIWDVPEGVWRVFFLIKTHRHDESKGSYIHMIDRESVSTLIEAVYEPHYQHYGHLFGNTIAGFFSDEPNFGNGIKDMSGYCGTMYDKVIGTYSMALPWSEELLARLNEKAGCSVLPYLPLLWYDRAEGDGPSAPDMRVMYMDVVTALWRENFSFQLGDWCRAHGVEYIGHIIEDMNAHAHLGCSGGHYFRSLDGQDMAGMDFVLHQYIPGMDHHPHSATCSGYATDPEFYHYTLAKLAASHAHLQPNMRGRAMCEVFGAFGWAESVSFMKAMMDHLLVRGVNHFVPHAFSMKYPDPDCPPHFFADGGNPEFPAFGKLMRYSNRIADLLCGAEHMADAAILYHAEAEWGSSTQIDTPFMRSQEPARRLYDRQIDYDIVPADFILDGAEMRNGNLVLGRACCEAGEERRCLIVPGTQYLPSELIARLEALCAQGLKLIFVNEKPASCSCGEIIALDDLADAIIARGWARIQLDKPFDMLRAMHVKRGTADIFMMVNESVSDRAEAVCSLPVSGDYVRMDVMQDCVYRGTSDGSLRVSLAPGQSMLYVFDGMQGQSEYDALPLDGQDLAAEQPQLEWRISAADYTALDDYKPLQETQLVNMTGFKSELGPGFSGQVKYEATLCVENAADIVRLSLGEANNCAQLTLNGEPLGWQIGAPYEWHVAGKLHDGKNELCITVANTLCGTVRDFFSHYVQMPRMGLFGPVRIARK